MGETFSKYLNLLINKCECADQLKNLPLTKRLPELLATPNWFLATHV